MQIFLIKTGVGLDNAKAACRAAIASGQWDLMISSGFAGALGSSPIGEVLVANQVLFYPLDAENLLVADPIDCHPAVCAKAFQVARVIGEAPRLGLIVTVPRIVCLGVEKSQLAKQTEGIGLDMESAVIGALAREHHLPFLVVRTVSDLVNEDFPVDLNLFRASRVGRRGLAFVLTRPSAWMGFARLARQMFLASKQITRFFEEFLRQVGQDGLPIPNGG